MPNSKPGIYPKVGFLGKIRQMPNLGRPDISSVHISGFFSQKSNFEIKWVHTAMNLDLWELNFGDFRSNFHKYRIIDFNNLKIK